MFNWKKLIFPLIFLLFLYINVLGADLKCPGPGCPDPPDPPCPGSGCPDLIIKKPEPNKKPEPKPSPEIEKKLDTTDVKPKEKEK